MYMLTLLSLISLIAVIGLTVASVFAGAGLFTFLCISVIICIIAGAFLLVKLLLKGVFSLLKCVILLGTMLIPVVNVAVLTIIAVCAVKSLLNVKE